MKFYFAFTLFLFIVTFVYAENKLDKFFFDMVNNNTLQDITWKHHPYLFNDYRLLSFRKDNIEALFKVWFSDCLVIEKKKESDCAYGKASSSKYMTVYTNGKIAIKNIDTIDSHIMKNAMIIASFKDSINFENVTIVKGNKILDYLHKH